MRILVNSHVNDQSPTVECDGYIPIVLRWPQSSKFPPIYWRFGDFEKSLIEIGINELTGSICEITVTSLSSIKKGLPCSKGKSVELVSGLPCCDLKLWPEGIRRIDEKSEVQAFYEGSTFLLRIKRIKGPEKIYCIAEYHSDYVYFRLNQDRALFEIEVRNLNRNEIENLIRSV